MVGFDKKRLDTREAFAKLNKEQSVRKGWRKDIGELHLLALLFVLEHIAAFLDNIAAVRRVKFLEASHSLRVTRDNCKALTDVAADYLDKQIGHRAKVDRAGAQMNVYVERGKSFLGLHPDFYPSTQWGKNLAEGLEPLDAMDPLPTRFVFLIFGSYKPRFRCTSCEEEPFRKLVVDGARVRGYWGLARAHGHGFTHGFDKKHLMEATAVIVINATHTEGTLEEFHEFLSNHSWIRDGMKGKQEVIPPKLIDEFLTKLLAISSYDGPPPSPFLSFLRSAGSKLKKKLKKKAKEAKNVMDKVKLSKNILEVLEVLGVMGKDRARRAKARVKQRKRMENPVTKEKARVAQRKRMENPVTKEKARVAQRKRMENPVTAEKKRKRDRENKRKTRAAKKQHL